jgi:hypothetical protein
MRIEKRRYAYSYEVIKGEREKGKGILRGDYRLISIENCPYERACYCGFYIGKIKADKGGD